MATFLTIVHKAVAIAPLLALASCASASEEPDPIPAESEPSAEGVFSDVVYEVDSSAPSGQLTPHVDVTYETNAGIQETSSRDFDDAESFDGPLTVTLIAFDDEHLSVSGRNTEAYGTVTCRIKIDAVVVSEDTASGAFATASCAAET